MAWILLLAVLVGVAAALLARPVGSYVPSPSHEAGLTATQFAEIAAIVVFGGLGVWLVLSLRSLSTRIPFPQQAIATILVMLLLGVLFVEVAGLVHVAAIPTSGNSTGAPPGGSGTGGNGSTNSTPGPLGTPGITLPAWAGFAVIVGIAVLAGMLLVPFLIARAEERRREREGPGRSAQAAHRAFQETLDRLTSRDGGDPRSAILALYSRLLQLVEPRLGTVESRTPREIERDSIQTLGLRPSVAQELTDTFEEARYSSHSMTPEAVGRARVALNEAIVDLAKSAGARP